VVTKHLEIEFKLEVLPDAVMPDLSELPAVTEVELLEESVLEAVYFDTPDVRLARAGATLRRRTGGHGAGWHLKLPVSVDARTEIHSPLGPDDEVPVEFVTAVRARVREEPLTPVVALRTLRTVRLLRGGPGRVLAEVSDDRVTSRSLGASEVAIDTWREWEVELVEGDRNLLSSAQELLGAAGGTTPEWSSKLARALGDRLRSVGLDGDQVHVDAGSAGAALRDHLRGRRDELLECDSRVRRDEPDGVHQMRVTTRELRSALATFRPLVVRERSEAVREELGWLGGLLGLVRDVEVGRGRLAELVAGEPGELVIGPVAERLDANRAGAYRSAHHQVLEALDSGRYFRLLDALDNLVDDLPLTEAATGQAGDVLPELVRRDWKRLSRAFAAARKAPPGQRRDMFLHETRKAAKRARYSAEAVIPVAGRRAEKFARAAKKLQTLLGEHHDSVELRAVLLQVATEAHLDGQDSFTYGRLHAIEQARAERIKQELPKVWHKVASRRRRRWMR
jgi:CHAD domain-containing protein